VGANKLYCSCLELVLHLLFTKHLSLCMYAFLWEGGGGECWSPDMMRLSLLVLVKTELNSMVSSI